MRHAVCNSSRLSVGSKNKLIEICRRSTYSESRLNCASPRIFSAFFTAHGQYVAAHGILKNVFLQLESNEFLIAFPNWFRRKKESDSASRVLTSTQKCWITGGKLKINVSSLISLMELRIVQIKRFRRSHSVSEIDSLIIYVGMTNDDSADLHWDIEFQWTAWIFYCRQKLVRSLVPGGESACCNTPTRLLPVCFVFLRNTFRVHRDFVKLICASRKTCLIDLVLPKCSILPINLEMLVKFLFKKQKNRARFIWSAYSYKCIWLKIKLNFWKRQQCHDLWRQYFLTAVLSALELILFKI